MTLEELRLMEAVIGYARVKALADDKSYVDRPLENARKIIEREIKIKTIDIPHGGYSDKIEKCPECGLSYSHMSNCSQGRD